MSGLGMRAIAMIVLVVAAAMPCMAEAVDDAFVRLVGVRTLRCVLTKGTQASWDGGTLKLEPADFGDGGHVVFDEIDVKQRNARLTGNTGAREVAVLPTAQGLTFIEQTAMGSTNVTTVFAAYDSPSSQKFVAVQSRHQLIIVDPFPSQYHGTCVVLESRPK